ncbi:hypothetical protein [Geodermatophilus sp. SYSU D01119]
MRRTAAALALLLCAGCGGAPTASSSAPSSAPSPSLSSAVPSSPAAPSSGPAVPPVDGIEAEAVELRTDAAVGGQVQVRVTDTGAGPFTVTAVAIDSPGFAPLPDRPVEAAFVPGRVIDLPAPYGDAVCTAAVEPAAARLAAVRPDGRSEVLRVPLAAADLVRIHADTCAAQAALAVAGLTVTGLTLDGDAVTGALALTRGGDDERAVTLTRLDGNVLYDVAADLPATLGEGVDEREVGLEFTTARCDPHALAEVKQPYLFVLGVQVDGEDEVTVDLPLDQAQRDVLFALTESAC